MFEIAEPVTTITDYALAAASVYFAAMLARGLRPQNRTCGRLWVLGFAVTAVAAALGGTFHGFVMQSLWNATMVAIGTSGAFMVAGVLASSIKKSDESRIWLWRGLIATFVGFGVQATGFREGLNFNHNDVFHVIQIVSLYFFFKGARLLEDRH